MRENSNLLKNFVQEQLKKEIQELRADKKAMESKYSKLEEFVVEALAGEIAEFQEDKKDLAETKVRLVREAKTQIAKVKKTLSKAVQSVWYLKQLTKV
jgi:DNA repair exonuclease SbcCD ATPase subunit